MNLFVAIIRKFGDLYVAECPQLGTVSQGTSIDEALEKLKTATKLQLEGQELENQEFPIITFFDI